MLKCIKNKKFFLEHKLMQELVHISIIIFQILEKSNRNKFN